MNQPEQNQVDLREADAQADAEWDHYRRLDRLVDHWDRPGWTEGRRSYHWMITFEDSPALQSLAAQCQAGLNDMPHLDQVPLEYLHLTLRRLAFTDEISADDAHRFAKRMDQRCKIRPPFALRVGPLVGSSGAVRFSVSPYEPVTQLRSLASDVSSDPATVGTFVPHVSIAYSNSDVAASATRERVLKLRSRGSIVVRVNALSLVELRRDGHRYLWESLRKIRLDG